MSAELLFSVPHAALTQLSSVSLVSAAPVSAGSSNSSGAENDSAGTQAALGATRVGVFLAVEGSNGEMLSLSPSLFNFRKKRGWLSWSLNVVSWLQIEAYVTDGCLLVGKIMGRVHIATEITAKLKQSCTLHCGGVTRHRS